MTRLVAGGWELVLLPDIGGSIGSLRWRGQDILRPTPAGTVDPLQTASFPLVPYVNRIANRRFAFGGRHWLLPANFGDHPHSLHGVGWQRPWSVVRAGDSGATLVLDHPGGSGWPWPFRAEQHFDLADDGLTTPAGLGFHPYFPRHADSRLTANASAAWTADSTQLPLARVGPDHFGSWAEGDSVARPALVDNAYEGWDGHAQFEGGGLSVRLVATGTSGLHIYIPPGERFFCVEPVTHLPDAINRGGMPLLQPGETLSISLRILIDQPG